MSQRGLTLVEMLLAISVVAVVMGAASRAYTMGIRNETEMTRIREMESGRSRLEDGITRILREARLGDTGFFQSPSPGGGSKVGSSALGSGASSIVLTSFGSGGHERFLQEEGQNFETLNQKFGPNGGPAEVSLSTLPVGDAGGKSGLFLREQTPPDDDPAQGGQEELFDPRVQDIRFEFFDGTRWLPAWDTTADQKGKLPLAVRVRYSLVADPAAHTFQVRIPAAKGEKTS